MLRLLPVLLAALLLAPAAAAAQDSTVVYLVRHAEKVDSDDADPPLSAAGETRARALAARLADVELDAVLVTQYRRSHATARPVLDALRLAPWQLPTRGGALPHLELVADAIHGPLAGRRVLLVGHTTTVPRILQMLGGPELPVLCETEYAHLFVVVLRPGTPSRVERESYGAADPPDAAECERE
jgi:phosphohistidine phosphatase SixA